MKVHIYMNGETEILKEGTIKGHVCCDCGLVHQRHILRARGGQAEIRYFRDDWGTKKVRRKNEKKNRD